MDPYDEPPVPDRTGPPLDERPDRTPAEQDDDASLIRWMLSLTPAERLDVLQRHVDAVEALRDGT